MLESIRKNGEAGFICETLSLVRVMFDEITNAGPVETQRMLVCHGSSQIYSSKTVGEMATHFTISSIFFRVERVHTRA